jgi:hypothetical protein
MWLFFAMIGSALLLAALVGAALSWDGSWYLFRILDDQAPFTPHGRTAGAALHWITIQTSRFTEDLDVLRVVFGLSYAAIPLIALLLSWWIARKHDPRLFIWPALGIGLGTLPSQIVLVQDATVSLQLFWPLLLVVLTGAHAPEALLAFGLGVALIFVHPNAVPLLGIVAMAALLIGGVQRERRRQLWLTAAFLLAAALAKYALSPRTDYEAAQLSRDVFFGYFSIGVAGAPIISLIGAYLCAALLLLQNAFPNQTKPRRILAVAAGGCVVWSGSVLAVWALDPRQWEFAPTFRFWAPVLSLPFVAGAVLEAAQRTVHTDRTAQDEEVRVPLVRAIGAVFLIVLGTQSAHWASMTSRLRESVDNAQAQCIPMSSLAWLERTPLYYWGTPTYALLLEGRRPRKLVLDHENCDKARVADTIELVPWGELRHRSWGWFDLRHVGRDSVEVASATTSVVSPSAYRVRWVDHDVPSRMEAGADHRLTATVTNISDATWPSQSHDGGPANVIVVSYHWRTADGSGLVIWEGKRSILPRDVKPGEAVTVEGITVTAPEDPGAYTLELTLLNELVAWFDAQGAATARIPVVVEQTAVPLQDQRDEETD